MTRHPPAAPVCVHAVIANVAVPADPPSAALPRPPASPRLQATSSALMSLAVAFGISSQVTFIPSMLVVHETELPAVFELLPPLPQASERVTSKGAQARDALDMPEQYFRAQRGKRELPLERRMESPQGLHPLTPTIAAIDWPHTRHVRTSTHTVSDARA